MEPLIICRCEEVSLEEIARTARDFQCSAREVKLRTRAGMGYCGGRTCRPAVDSILRDVMDQRTGHEIPLKIQTPVRPVSLTTLGSRVKLDE